MKPTLWFAIAALVGLWAVDKLAFDGEYGAKVWKESNSDGQDWQR